MFDTARFFGFDRFEHFERPLVRSDQILDHLLGLSRIWRELANAQRQTVDLVAALTRQTVARLTARVS